MVEEDKSPIKEFLSKRKQQLHNQKEIQNRIEKNQKQKAEMAMYAGASKSLEDINITMGLDIITARNYELTSLMGLDCRPELKSLNLHYNYLVSFKYLQTQPQLEEIHIPMNTICSFYGFSFQPRLKWVNLNGNPIVRHGLYRIMCLLAGNLNIKTIGKKLVQIKEKRLAESYLALYPQAKEAIRAGWLIDLENHPRCELIEGSKGKSFDNVINEFQARDLDDSEDIKQSEQFKKLISGDYAYKLETFEEFIDSKVNKIKKASSGKKKKTGGKDTKIQSLKKKIEKLNLDLKQLRAFNQQQMQLQEQMKADLEISLRERLREELSKELIENGVISKASSKPPDEAQDSNLETPIKGGSSLQDSEVETPQKRLNSALSVEDIVYFDIIQLRSFTYVYHDGLTSTEKRCNKVRLQFSVDAIIVVTQDDLAECEILYSDILKNGFFLGDSGLARIRISLVSGDSIDLFSKEAGLARSAFKALHMFIEAHKQSIKPLISPNATPLQPGSVIKSFSNQNINQQSPNSGELSNEIEFSENNSSEDLAFKLQQQSSQELNNQDTTQNESENERRALPDIPQITNIEDTVEENIQEIVEENVQDLVLSDNSVESNIELLESQENVNLTNETLEHNASTLQKEIEEGALQDEQTIELGESKTTLSIEEEQLQDQKLIDEYQSEIQKDREDSELYEEQFVEENSYTQLNDSKIEAPILRNRNHVPEPNTSTYESPSLRSGEDTEAMQLAKEERERREKEMRELFEAFQKLALEYGKEKASEWLKLELSKLSPQEQTRKELEILERFHLVKQAKKLFERGA